MARLQVHVRLMELASTVARPMRSLEVVRVIWPPGFERQTPPPPPRRHGRNGVHQNPVMVVVCPASGQVVVHSV